MDNRGYYDDSKKEQSVKTKHSIKRGHTRSLRPPPAREEYQAASHEGHSAFERRSSPSPGLQSTYLAATNSATFPRENQTSDDSSEMYRLFWNEARAKGLRTGVSDFRVSETDGGRGNFQRKLDTSKATHPLNTGKRMHSLVHGVALEGHKTLKRNKQKASSTWSRNKEAPDDSPGAFAVQGQVSERRTLSDSPALQEEEQTVPSSNDMLEIAVSAEIAPEEEDAQARIDTRVHEEVQRVLEQTTAARNPQRWKRSIALIICLLLVLVLALAGGLTAAILAIQNSKRDTGSAANEPTAPPITDPTLDPSTHSTTNPPNSLPPTDLSTTVAPTDSLITLAPATDPPTLVTPILPDGPWQQLGQDIDGKNAGEESGWSVALSKDASVVAVGAPGYRNSSSIPGYVRLYQYDGGTTTWQELGQELAGQVVFDEFGTSVSINDEADVVAIGSRQFFSSPKGFGSVRVYQYDPSTTSWIRMGQELIGDGFGDVFGKCVSLSGDGLLLAVGAPVSDKGSINSGLARVYKYDTGTSEWRQQGQDLIGKAAEDQFGSSISLNSKGNIVAIGANQWDGSNSESGTGYVTAYQFDATISAWIQMGRELVGESNGDAFGDSVSLSGAGNVLAVGATLNDGNGIDSGCVYTYQYDMMTLSWASLGQQINGEASHDFFGYSVSLSNQGTVLAVGADGSDNNGVSAGHVRIYKYNVGTLSWTQVGNNIDGEEAYDNSGWSVSLSGNGAVVAIGAPYNNVDNSGHVRVYTLN